MTSQTASRDPADPTLGSGGAGLAVLYAVVSRVLGGSDRRQQALQHWRASIEGLPRVACDPGLLSGFAGVGWATAFLESEWLDPGELDRHEDLDAALLERLETNASDVPYDLAAGLVGYGVYALARPEAHRARTLATRCVESLASQAVEAEEGIAWLSRPGESAVGWQRELPGGYYDLGMAHGVAGVLAFLSRCVEEAIAPDTACRLLERAVPWLLARRIAGGALEYPSLIMEAGEPVGRRLGWCYGDLAIASALLSAGRALRRVAWEERAIDAALHLTPIVWDRKIVTNVGLCHGASGVAHLFHRLGQATDRDELLAAARYWTEVTLDMHDELLALAASKDTNRPATGRKTPSQRFGLLEGSAGMALALLAAASDVPPTWDHVLLLPA